MQQNQAEAKSTAGVLAEFQTEFAECWQRLPNKALFFTLLIAWLALFQLLGNSILGYIDTRSLFSWMYECYNSPNVTNDSGYGNFIPFLVLGLLWWKRKELLALPLEMWWPGLLILVGAMVAHVLGYVLQAPQLSIVALFAGIYGLTGLAWGYQWLKKTFFPFFLFAFSVPLGAHGEIITFPLRQLATWLVELVAHYILGIDVLRVGTQLFDPSGAYQYDVAAACSGIRSLVAIFLLATVYGFLTFRSLWKRLLLMATAFPFAVLGNLVRLLCIIIAAAVGGQKAGDYVHEGGPFGIISLLPYVPAIFGLLWLGGWLKEKRLSPQSSPNE